MSKEEKHSISIKAARQLTNTTKTTPQMVALSPKYLLKMLPWQEVPGGHLPNQSDKVDFQIGRTYRH